MVIPSLETLLSAVKAIREQHPDLGRTKVRMKLLNDHPDWELSDKRLKKVMDSHHMKTAEHERQRQAENPMSQPAPILPSHPLDEQLRYKEQSARMFILYGVEYDFGVSPNVDMGAYIDLCQRYITDFHDRCGNEPNDEQCQTLASTRSVQSLWRFYQAAARKAGISHAHVSRQFQAEYYCDPRTGEEKDAAKKAEMEREEIERHKMMKIEFLRIAAMECPGCVEVDDEGNIIYEEEKDGRYAFTIARIDKQTGQEIETVYSFDLLGFKRRN